MDKTLQLARIIVDEVLRTIGTRSNPQDRESAAVNVAAIISATQDTDTSVSDGTA